MDERITTFFDMADALAVNEVDLEDIKTWQVFFWLSYYYFSFFSKDEQELYKEIYTEILNIFLPAAEMASQAATQHIPGHIKDDEILPLAFFSPVLLRNANLTKEPQ